MCFGGMSHQPSPRILFMFCRQQVMFLEQLFDLHRAIAIQKLLMQNCPEVQQVRQEGV